MKKALLLIIITLFVTPFAFASVQEGKKLFETKCGTCHSLERSLRVTKDLMAWKRTIKRMDRYAKGKIPETEAEEIAEYLVSIGKPETPASHEISKEEIKGLDERELFDFKKVQVDQFIDPSVCGGCHS
jgi:cytochrome c